MTIQRSRILKSRPQIKPLVPLLSEQKSMTIILGLAFVSVCAVNVKQLKSGAHSGGAWLWACFIEIVRTVGVD